MTNTDASEGSKKRFLIEVRQEVEVELDSSIYTEERLAEFRESFYDFHTLSDHAEHIAQLMARGLFNWPSDFIEGYGVANKEGISAKVIDTDVELLEQGFVK